jgi:energy-converting hydrogenase Eha subunit C
VHDAFDNPPYRYGHPLFGWLGWLASAGQASAAAPALLAVGLLAIFVAGAAAAALGRGWEALFVALNPGLLYAASHDLAEPLCAALLLLALNASVRERRTLLLASLALLPLAKEPLILVTAALVIWRRDLRLVATVVPAVVWWIYARLTLGDWFTAGDNGLGVPFRGWVHALVDAGVDSYNVEPGRNQLGQAALVVFVGLLGLLAFAAVRALRFRTPVDLVYLALAAVAACLAPIATVLLRDALRNTAVLFVLVPFVGTVEYSRRWSTRH